VYQYLHLYILVIFIPSTEPTPPCQKLRRCLSRAQSQTLQVLMVVERVVDATADTTFDKPTSLLHLGTVTILVVVVVDSM